MTLIDFNKITKIYQGDLFKKKTHALSGVSFAVNQGEVFGIIGRNGAGKSTTIKILMGFVKPDNGRVSLAGLDPKLAKCHNNLGYLPESPCLYPHLSINDHLKFAAVTAGIPAGDIKSSIIQKILQRVGLESVADTKIKNYSKGMTQRAALAYAIIHNPDILILDEPMSGLDPFGRQIIIDVIKEYRQLKKTVLFCSHILTDVERICDRIGVMNKGRMIKIIQPKEIAATITNYKSPLETMFMKLVSSHSGDGQ